MPEERSPVWYVPGTRVRLFSPEPRWNKKILGRIVGGGYEYSSGLCYIVALDSAFRGTVDNEVSAPIYINTIVVHKDSVFLEEDE